MLINTTNVIMDLKPFFNATKNYENNILLLNKEINNIYASWSGNMAESFKQSYSKEESANQLLSNQMNKIYNLINSSINSYATVANKIEVNLNSKNRIFDSLDKINSRIKKITNIAESNEEAKKILPYLSSIKILFRDVQKKTKDTFRKLEIIEKDLNNKLNALDIINVDDFRVENTDYQQVLNQINSDEVIKSKDIISTLGYDEKNNLDLLNTLLDSILANFKITNSSKLEELCSNLVDTGRNLNSNREHYIKTLDEVLLAFENSANTTISLLDKE